nr:hypothetical protein [uncultured Flavobacterium sp.]
MRNEVIAFLADKSGDKFERFKKGFALYRDAPMKNPSAERSYNVLGCKDETLKSLEYDLMKAYNIKEREVHEFVYNQQTEAKQNTDNGLLTADEAAGALKLVGEQLGVTTGDLDHALNVKNLDNQVLGVESIIDQEGQYSLREKYPFLKSEDCPAELKILVADKITAWQNYTAARAQIELVQDGSVKPEDVDLNELAKQADENYAKNEAITKELDHYLEFNELLGEHPIFFQLQMQREVEEMTTDELIKFKNATVKYFSDNKKKLEKAEAAQDEKVIVKINEAVSKRKSKLSLVNKRLGINE